MNYQFFEDRIVKLFDFFYSKVYNNSNFKLDLSKAKHKKQIENFIKLIAQHYQLPSIGSQFLVDYFYFAFGQWYDRITERRISLGWIIGRKMFGTWFNSTSEQKYYARLFLYKTGIDLTEISQQLDQLEDRKINEALDAAEELEKKRFEGQARLYHCTNYTTLFNHISKTCVLCVNRAVCKDLLKNVNKPLYQKRGYK